MQDCYDKAVEELENQLSENEITYNEFRIEMKYLDLTYHETQCNCEEGHY